MSLNPLKRLMRSAAMRLSLWFAVIFIASVAGIFGLLYYLLGATIDRNDRAVLQAYLKDYADIYQLQGLGALRDRVYEEDAPPAQKSLFVRLASGQNEITFAKVPEDWIGFAQVDPGLQGSRQNSRIVRIPEDAERDFLLDSAVLPDGSLFQVGRSTNNREVMLDPLRHTFLLVGSVVVLLGLIAGAFFAHRTMLPVRQIVATAAEASTHVQTTRIEVDGYTDLSGTVPYNQKLSVRRAATVQAELVRDGVPSSEISIHGYGESNPLVPTAPGVREPQNRRVEIVLK